MSGIEPVLIAGGVWLWQSYGKDALTWLVERLAKRAEDLKADGWEKIDWSLASRRYREELSRLYGTMHIFGMSQSVPLGSIFTDVYLLDKPSAWRRHAIEELQARSQEQHESLLREQRREGLALVQAHKRLYILGQPGAGKTTFLKYLVLQAVAGKLEAIPIFLSLKAWSDAKIDLLPFLVRQFAICAFPDAQPFIEQILEDGKAIVLFDGLDEVNLEGGARARIIGAVHDFARQYGKSRVVITCRTAASEYVFEGFSYCELAEFTSEQMEAFVGRWFQQYEVKRQAFWKAFTQPEHERLRDLGRRPLLLTMLCLTFEETMAFPQRRAELYEEAIDALLKKWDISRSIQRDTVYRELSLGYKRQLLMEIAAESFERGELFMRKHDLVSRVVAFLRRLPSANSIEEVDGEALLRSIEAQHGLLIERARDIYSFSHLTFHEYFAARYITDHPKLSVLRSVVFHATDPRWREVLLLTTSMLDYRNVADLFACWCEQLQQDVLASAELTAFIHFVDDQFASGQPRSLQARAAVMMAALLKCVSVQSTQLANALDLPHARAFNLDSISALELADTLVSAGAPDLVRVHALDLARALDRALDRARSLARALDRAIANAYIRPNASTRGLDRALDRARSLDRTLDLASVLSRIHAAALDAQAPEIHARTYPSPSQIEPLLPGLLSPLERYLASIERLLDCLGVAVVEDRKALLNRLLCLPDQSNAAYTA